MIHKFIFLHHGLLMSKTFEVTWQWQVNPLCIGAQCHWGEGTQPTKSTPLQKRRVYVVQKMNNKVFHYLHKEY